jgi:hypothetical protein
MAAEVRGYFGLFRRFSPLDWAVYLAWVGMIAGLALVSALFLHAGRQVGAPFPSEAYLLPAGAAVFALAIAVDTIGHRTIYKEILRGGEQLVHHITIASGVGSCALLIAAYPQRRAVAVLALVLTGLSFFYSAVDEVMHWRRYLQGRSNRIETWSHVGILFGHGTMMLGWWCWYFRGYSGVAETLTALGG